MIICPCGQTVDEATSSWPPYRVTTSDAMGNILFAICIHGCVVIDKLKKEELECQENANVIGAKGKSDQEK